MTFISPLKFSSFTSCTYCSSVVDAENKGSTLESKVTKETIDFKEVKRVDHILTSLQCKLPPAPPPPPFQKVILQQPEKLRMALKPNKQGSRNLLLSIPSSIKVQLKECNFEYRLQ